MGEGRKKLLKVYRVPGNMQLPHEPQIFGYVPSDAPNIISREGSSFLHDIFCKHIFYKNLKHLVGESLRLALLQKQKILFE